MRAGPGPEGVRAGPRATRVLRGRVTAAGSQGRAGGPRLHGDPVTIANAVPALQCAHDAPTTRPAVHAHSHSKLLTRPGGLGVLYLMQLAVRLFF